MIIPNERINTGIAIVVPAQKIAEMFRNPAFEEVIERVRRDWREENLPMQDSSD
jgi:hypothetical protein